MTAVVLAAAVVTAAGGCAESTPDDSTEPATSETADAAEIPDPPEDSASDEASTSTAESSTTVGAAGSAEDTTGSGFGSGSTGVADLGDVQIRHESGVVVTLERLVVEPAYVVLEFSAANGSVDEVALAGDTARGITLTVDDPAAMMTYQAPSVNETLELSSGEVLEAEIVFLGVLPGDAATMEVTFNPEPEPDGDVAEPTIRAVAIPIVAAAG